MMLCRLILLNLLVSRRVAKVCWSKPEKPLGFLLCGYAQIESLKKTLILLLESDTIK